MKKNIFKIGAGLFVAGMMFTSCGEDAAAIQAKIDESVSEEVTTQLEELGDPCMESVRTMAMAKADSLMALTTTRAATKPKPKAPTSNTSTSTPTPKEEPKIVKGGKVNDDGKASGTTEGKPTGGGKGGKVNSDGKASGTTEGKPTGGGKGGKVKGGGK